ncbi:5-methylcytosine restriction system specificity protein McrC [Devosia sp. XGJD_8]|uniref:5-methylcytosine restriction system specificity protein McrC n=1 Tax=Devosia sp. XGJD_8 TaxID=3391187 RepID=UPI00398559A2
MLLYAWNHFQAGPVTDIGQDQSPDLPTLLAKVLLTGSNRLLRRGVDRGYRQSVEHTRSPRGRLLLDDMIKQQTMMRGVAVCEFDELTPNVLHNRILRSTLLALAACREIHRDLRHELRLTARRFHDVCDVRLTGDLFHRVQLSRNTAQYGLLMRTCEFVFHSLMPDEQGPGTRFESILKDEVRMSALFEDFLRNFYRSEFPQYKIGSEILSWEAESENPESLRLLPGMQTDITVRSETQTLIIDAKFYSQTLASGRYGQRIRSTHLYQLASYLAHEARRPDRQVSGMLLYPRTTIDLEERYGLLGQSVTVATIDLSASWSEVGECLRNLLAASISG